MERITNTHITRQAERLSRNLGVRVAAGKSDYKIWRCHVGGNADTQGNGFTIAVAGTARELFDAMYAANNALEFVALAQHRERMAYERLLADAAEGDPGELEEHKYLLPREGESEDA